MRSAPIHPDEVKRLKELYRYEILDTDDERVFDELTELASYITGSSVSLISLIDSDRQWFKSRRGLDARQTHRDLAFCAHAILQAGVFEVQNAPEDERFTDNPLVVGEPDIRFYAGSPLISKNGLPIGTLCVIDSEPKKLSEDQKRALELLSKQVIDQLELRLQVQKQKKLEKFKKQLLTTIAHDLRSPFNGILNGLEILVDPDESDIALKTAMGNELVKSARSVYDLLDELLQWAQLQLEEPMVRKSTLPAQDLIMQTVELYAKPINEKSLDVSWICRTDQRIFADPVLLKSVLRNLVSNSVKFTPTEGSIRISVEGINSGSGTTLAIENSGAGIPERVRESIFTRSVKSYTGTAGEKGSGLGLSLCADFMELQGGRIWIDDEYTNGSRLLLYLPGEDEDKAH